MKEYKEYQEYKKQPNKNYSPVKGKHKIKEGPNEEMEEKMKDFEHILKIINLYIEYMNKIDKIKEKEKAKNEKGW